MAVVCADTGYRRSVDRMRRDFVTNVSHELKTPVGAIMLLSETIADAGDDVEVIRHFAGRIGMEAQNMAIRLCDVDGHVAVLGRIVDRVLYKVLEGDVHGGGVHAHGERPIYGTPMRAMTWR